MAKRAPAGTRCLVFAKPRRGGRVLRTRRRITINDSESSEGRDQAAEMARGFMQAFPDLVLRMDDVRSTGTHAVFRWTLEGHYNGPDGTGRQVQIGGFEY